MKEQEINIPLKPGSQVTIFNDVDIDADGSFAAGVVFDDTVVQYVPHTGKLQFAKSDIGLSEFQDMLYEHESVQVVRS